jgi:DNA-binding transcriptional MerR regulator
VTSWTIDELASRVAELLAAQGVRATSGRVTPVPDRRVIRWYATIGLLDRPLRAGGRTARYDERHLLQLIAVKRRQAEGRSLTEIQTELAGAPDTVLRRVAAFPEPATADPPPPRTPEVTLREQVRAAVPTLPVRPAPPVVPADTTGTTAAVSAETEKPTATPGHAATTSGAPEPTVHYRVPLHPAVSLTLPARPSEDELAAIHAAATDLLHLLATRGLLA